MENSICGDPCAPVRNAYDIATVNAAARYPSAYIPTFASIQSRLNRKRATSFPPIPQTITDVAVVGPWQRTWNDKQFLIHIDNGWGVAMFATHKSLRILAACTVIFVDGTFRTAPKPYKQLVTIHGMYRGVVVPLCFCLSTGKSVAQYRHIIHELCRKIREQTRIRWRPATVVCDFEVSLISALQTELPGVRVRGCYFHFSQSLWRRFSSLGLVSHYRAHTASGRRLRKFVQKNIALGYLPAAIIANTFNAYLASPEVQRICRRFPILHDYVSYIQRVYIARTASFRPPMWSVYDREIDVRTNNVVER
jgi:hypothetical protein